LLRLRRLLANGRRRGDHDEEREEHDRTLQKSHHSLVH
jgi:hypothetical protein